MAKKTTKLTDMQAAFVAHYLVTLNAKRSAAAAGYSENTAEVQGYQLLQNPSVSRAIKRGMEARAKRLQLKADRVLEEIARIAFSDIRDVCEFDAEDGVKFAPSIDLAADAAAAIQSVTSEVAIRGGGRTDSEPVKTTKIRVKLHDKMKALDLAGRHLGLWSSSDPGDQDQGSSPDHLPPASSFEEFCIRAGYPPPFSTQCDMRAFVFDDDSNKARLLLGARGYGKTDYTTLLGSAFKIHRDPQYTILIMTKSDTKNAAIVEEIAKALRANGSQLEKDNAHDLRVKGLHGKDHSVSAVTVGSNTLRGRHPDLIIMDDPVTEEDISEATRNRLQRKYNELTKLCQNIAIIGQPVHVFDLYETLRPLVKVMEVPHGTIPELDHDLVAMKLAGVSETSINASYHLKVTSETGNPLSGVSYIDKFPAGDSVAFIDPSFRGGDYTAMSVGRGHFDGIAIQGFCWKKAWFDCIPEIREACVALGIKRICFEINALGEQPLPVLRAELTGVGVVGKDSTGYKHARIMAVGPFAKFVHLSKTSHRAYIDQVIKYEYGSKFDDAPDSLASLLEWVGLIKGKK